MEEVKESKKILVDILDECKSKLDEIDIALSKKEDITISLDNINKEVEKIRKRLNTMQKNTSEGKDILRDNKEKLKGILFSLDLGYNAHIREIIISNLPDGIYAESSIEVRDKKIKYNEMYSLDIEEKVENSNDLNNTIFLFESIYNNNGKKKGMEYVCIGKIIIEDRDILDDSYSVTISINEEVKSVKEEYKEITLKVNNTLRIYNIISMLNTILYYGK